MNKATRTLWLVVLCFTTAMPFPSFQKPQQKTAILNTYNKSVYGRGQWLSTADDTHCQFQEQNAGAAVLLLMPAPDACS
jgi:hypothetical protein